MSTDVKDTHLIDTKASELLGKSYRPRKAGSLKDWEQPKRLPGIGKPFFLLAQEA